MRINVGKGQWVGHSSKMLCKDLSCFCSFSIDLAIYFFGDGLGAGREGPRAGVAGVESWIGLRGTLMIVEVASFLSFSLRWIMLENKWPFIWLFF